MTATTEIGVIGGSGLYNMSALSDVQEVAIDTPFGQPSDALIVGTLDYVTVAFLARHGRNHMLLPSELPFRANIYGMKSLGVEYLISASAVGSLNEVVKPLDLLVVDQFIDRTKGRISTFFGEGIVAHIPFGNPTCPQLGKILGDAVKSLNLENVNQKKMVDVKFPTTSFKSEIATTGTGRLFLALSLELSAELLV